MTDPELVKVIADAIQEHGAEAGDIFDTIQTMYFRAVSAGVRVDPKLKDEGYTVLCSGLAFSIDISELH